MAQGAAQALKAEAANDRLPLSHNLNGQKLGRKGRETRERIIQAAADIVNEGEEAISLSAVARRAGLGMTSLYNYFSDLSELLVAVLEPVKADGEATFLHRLTVRWKDDEVETRAREFIDTYFEFWQRHTRILHLRNALADRYDENMMRVRVGAVTPILAGIRLQFAPDGAELDPKVGAMASVLVAGFERSIALTTDMSPPAQLARAFAPRREALIDSCTQLLTMAILQSRRT